MRKRNQGKAAKAREEAVERRNNNNNNQTTMLEAQMQRLQIGNAPAPVPISQNGVVKCRHGFEKMDNICANFVNAFECAYRDNVTVVRGGDPDLLLPCLVWVEVATRDEYSEVGMILPSWKWRCHTFCFVGLKIF
jgi:hypothetical protein